MKKILWFVLLVISIINADSNKSLCSNEDEKEKIEKILKGNQSDIGCMLILANKYLKDGEISKGFMYISKAYQLDPAKVKKDKSSKILDTALTLYALKQSAIETDNIDAWNYLGDKYFEMRVFPEAKSAYENSLRVNPFQNNIRILYAITLQSLKQHYRAANELDIVLHFDTNNLYAHYYLGKILKYNIGDNKKAITHFKNAKRLLKEKNHNLKNEEILYIIKGLKKELL